MGVHLIDENSRGFRENTIQEAVQGIKVDFVLFVKDDLEQPTENGSVETEVLKLLKLRLHDDVLLDPLCAGTAAKEKNSYVW